MSLRTNRFATENLSVSWSKSSHHFFHVSSTAGNISATRSDKLHLQNSTSRVCFTHRPSVWNYPAGIYNDSLHGMHSQSALPPKSRMPTHLTFNSIFQKESPSPNHHFLYPCSTSRWKSDEDFRSSEVHAGQTCLRPSLGYHVFTRTGSLKQTVVQDNMLVQPPITSSLRSRKKTPPKKWRFPSLTQDQNLDLKVSECSHACKDEASFSTLWAGSSFLPFEVQQKC